MARCEDAPCCGCCDPRELYQPAEHPDMEDDDSMECADDEDPEDMDGDAASALASAGHGTDEDYGDYGNYDLDN